jgi:hypothetical protein
MLKHLKFVAMLTIVVAHDIHTHIQARKAAQLFSEVTEAYRFAELANHAQISYLVHLLQENGIEPDEFDLIALHYNNQ